MFRKLLLPALAVGLLGGCVTSGYQYDRDGYYYGQPSTTYRYDDGYYNGRYDGRYDSRYGYPGSAPGYYGNFGYGTGYYGGGYRYPGYGYGRYPNGYYRPPVIVVRPGHGGNPGHRPPSPGGRNDRAPWRDYERLQNERIQQSTPPPTGNRPSSAVLRPAVPAQPRPMATPDRPMPQSSQGERNSRSDRMIERARISRQEE